MDKHKIPVSAQLYRSPLLPVSAVLYSGAAVLGFCSLLQLLNPDAMAALAEDLFHSGIMSASAMRTWQVIHVGVILAGFLCAAAMSGCLLLEFWSAAGKGLRCLYTLTHWGVYMLNALGAVVLGILICKAGRYVLECLTINEGLYYLYSMLVSEALMVALAVFLFVLTRRFLNSICDAAVSMAYSRTCGWLDTVSIPGLAPVGFLVCAVVNGFIAAERLFTVTIVKEYLNDHYGVLVAQHPILRLTAAACFLAAGANLLMGLYLRKYKSNTEWLLYQSWRQRMGTQS